MAVLTVFACFLVIVCITAQIPIPKREVGFIYNWSGMDAPIHFDFYVDLICPNSKEAWPTIVQLADYYGPKSLKLTTHLFPLPYHINSFYASKGTHILDRIPTGSQAYNWMQVIFDNMESLVNSATMSIPDNKIIQNFAELATKNFNFSSAMFTSMILSEDIEMATRLGWKYCCTRAIPHTPTFMVNDVVVNGDPTWTVTDWRTIIDPLLTKTVDHQDIAPISTCPPGIKSCE